MAYNYSELFRRISKKNLLLQNTFGRASGRKSSELSAEEQNIEHINTAKITETVKEATSQYPFHNNTPQFKIALLAYAAELVLEQRPEEIGKLRKNLQEVYSLDLQKIASGDIAIAQLRYNEKGILLNAEELTLYHSDRQEIDFRHLDDVIHQSTYAKQLLEMQMPDTDLPDDEYTRTEHDIREQFITHFCAA